MLGHLQPSLCGLGIDDKENYQAFYCAICASLRQQYGTSYSLLLNNELTLLLAAFQTDLEALEEIKTNCPAAAFVVKQHAFAHPAIEVAGKLSVVLGWIKALDWHTDKPHFLKKLLLNTLQKKVKHILPTLLPKSKETVADYAQITLENEQDFSLIRTHSATLARMLVKEVARETDAEPETITLLADIFGKAGELIAIADHLIDLDKDIAGKQYNPIAYYADQNKAPLAASYITLKVAYNHLKYSIQSLLPEANRAFAAAFQQSLHRLDSQIQKHLPACMHTEEARALIGQPQLAQASFANIPAMLPPASSCCDSQDCTICASSCLACSCQVCANSNACQGCCDNMCDGCCSGGGKGTTSTASERKQRRTDRRKRRQEEREAKRQARKAKNKNKIEPTEPDDMYK